MRCNDAIGMGVGDVAGVIAVIIIGMRVFGRVSRKIKPRHMHGIICCFDRYRGGLGDHRQSGEER